MDRVLRHVTLAVLVATVFLRLGDARRKPFSTLNKVKADNTSTAPPPQSHLSTLRDWIPRYQSHRQPCTAEEERRAACMLDGHCFALDFGDVMRGAFCACPELYVGSRCEQLSGDVLVKHLSLTHTPPLTTTASLVPVTHLKADNTNTTAANTTTTTTIIDININATIATTTTTTTTISLSVVLTWTAWIGGAVCGMLALFLFCFVMKMVRDQLTAITDKPHTLSPTTGPLGPLHIGELAELKTVLVEETTTRVMTSFSTSYCTLSAVMTCHDTVTDSQRHLSSFT